jgi:hypothetical protein
MVPSNSIRSRRGMLKDWQATDMASDGPSDGQALRSEGQPWRRPIGPSYISWNERRCTACQSRLALGAERVHSARRDENLPDFHESLREPKDIATKGLRKWIDPPAGERSRCDACPFCRSGRRLRLCSHQSMHPLPVRWAMQSELEHSANR